MIEWDTPTKEIPRQFVMNCPSTLPGQRAARTALTLPGWQMLCVQAGLTSGIFNQHTLHVFVERDPASQKHLIRRANTLACEWSPRFWRDDIHKLPLRSLLDNEPLDFAYLDFCAALNAQTARWVAAELSEAIENGATLAVTLSRNWRNGLYMKWWHDQVKHGGPARAEFNRVRRSLRTAAGGALRLERYRELSDEPLFIDTHGAPWAGEVQIPRDWVFDTEWSEACVKVISAFTALLPYHTYDFHGAISYFKNPEKGGHAMTTFVLTNLQRQSRSRFPQKFLQSIGDNVDPPMRIVKGNNDNSSNHR